MTEQHKPENNAANKAQSELDLEFNQMEPITPKKPVSQEPSLLDKAKEMVSSLGKKEGTSTETNTVETSESEVLVENNGTTEEVVVEQSTQTQDEPISRNLNKPERWAILSFIPPKYRRIFIVLLLAVIILLIISWLKPSSDTVNAFEQPSNSIPTQFQSLNQEQPMENNVLDNLNKGQPAQQADTQNAQSGSENAQTTVANAENSADNAQSNPATSPEPVAQPSVQTEQPVVPAVKPQPTPVEPKQVVETVKTASKPAAAQTQPKPQPKPVAKATTQTTNTSKPKAENKAQTAKKAEPKAEKKVPVVEAKPATSKTAGTSKTLTIPQGVSLMQVFRDNNLNISDVNAMTKANGAGNALSSFKPGDKVQISVNSQGRVEQLRLANGSTFIRQANGTYQYKK
ncbi:opacity-associated protein OapA [Avibacterium gallinarum]|uniref:Opacity associated protein n=1 Tax=Avibacterium gallinarum TaxID=755 RepID=A0A379AXU3_AVIGA|nr:LysM-like peptidoglycan-binding domain-containing protein [Avibacterium gallinarum]POY44594.1 opacity-associated protein OapA [Avibacterium gallinarum]TDP30384.1 opacity associated protein [Avibacterium gallinarum]SUB26884.1 opacity-associated protein OapA [Avibacterium gallinarum]